ncbi:hypothetical protein [Sediminispirochaeta bajacaliforniensis]|uniref:hypothetical protein n=1 Tax=Sediminispirochaeta bajacaliforniensis TaxID=148 RepID=UPI0012B64AD2|nr:hypothetical protein [Sediminispirochaeta bajacaliforniensis]
MKKASCIIVLLHLIAIAVFALPDSLPRNMDYSFFENENVTKIDGIGITYTTQDLSVNAFRPGVVYDLQKDDDPVFGKYVILLEEETVYIEKV